MKNIVFVIPFGSQKIYRDFDLATKLLQGTLNSIDNQTNHNYQVVVGCHEIPDVKIAGYPENVSFVQMQYDPLEEQYRQSPVRDMLMKVFTSLLSVKNLDFNYCMLVDADDRIHKNLVAFLDTAPLRDGYIINQGYQLDYSVQKVFPDNQINRICGTTVILSKSVTGIPQEYTKEEFIKCWWHKNIHHSMKEYYQKNSLSLDCVPFRAVQKTMFTGMNLSDDLFSVTKLQNLSKGIKRLLKFQIFGQKLSDKYLDNFGYNKVNLSANQKH